jgi:hypothetical protein
MLPIPRAHGGDGSAVAVDLAVFVTAPLSFVSMHVVEAKRIGVELSDGLEHTGIP